MLKRCFTLVMVVFCIAVCYTAAVYASDRLISVNGRIYEFGGDDQYAFSTALNTVSGVAFGKFSVIGDALGSGNMDGVPAYSVSSDNLSFQYSYDQVKLNAAETEWHLIEDKSKKIDDFSLEEKILHGAIVVQSSKDGENWITDVAISDAFTADTILPESLYTTKQIQLENGCYYRLIVVYELQRKIGESKILFVTTDDTEEKKIAEVYTFYAISSEVAGKTVDASATPRKELGYKVNTGKDTGFSKNMEISQDDPHYGWNLGTFVVNGYTRETFDSGTPVFLKNVGDKVTLWFTLAQDIQRLNGDNSLVISEDYNGSDQHFEISATNFKHGALVIRYTDFEGKMHDPVVYTDFLAANASTGADTRVQLFEEGDYEVSLDYEIKKSSIVPSYTNYKIFFRFAIRNGNCMVYPFDTVSGAELSDQAVSPNGFRLDIARSRYLTIDVVRSVLNVGTDGLLVEDVRFSRPAKDNESYTDDGIYTFTVKNLYTGENTTKTIYVGMNKYLLALSKNAFTVEELNEKIAEKATIDDDGTVIDYVPEPEPGPEPEPELEPAVTVEPILQPVAAIPAPEEPLEALSARTETETPMPIEEEPIQSPTWFAFVLPGATVVAVSVIAVCLIGKKRKRQKTATKSEELKK